MVKRITICLVILFLFIPVCVFGASINGRGAVIDANVLNIRSGPSTDYPVIGTFYSGDKLNIITRTAGEWYKIEYYGAVGFVHAAYVSASRSGEPSAVSKVNAFATTQTYEGSSKGQQVVEYAKQFLGVTYVYGGTTPNGFDCSGLVQYVYKQMGVSLNRVAADQTAHGVPVAPSDLMPGDIVFFHNTSRYTRINHVGIYVGGGNFIHAPQPGDVVKISTLNSGYYSTTFITARRIFN